MIPKPRTGSACLLAVVLAGAAWAGEPDITLQVDAPKVGTEDTFRAEIAISDPPANPQVSFPLDDSFEVLGRSQSTQMNYSMGPGGAGVISQVLRITFTLRANRTGKLTLPAATLKLANSSISSKPVSLEVVSGRLAPDRPRRPQAMNPFGFPPGFFPDEDLGDPFQEPDVPRNDSDLFIKSTLDKSEAYVGEQVVLSFYLYSRIDLSSVDSVNMPKLDGFLSQDFPTPNQLMSQQRVINGVPYREYLVRKKAIFPLHAGAVDVEAIEADITTGSIFQGRRVHRKGNELHLVVRNLPPGPATTIVGKWRLAREVSQTEVALGEPVQVKFMLEGRGSLQQVQLPPLEVPGAFRTFDPETTDKPIVNKTSVGGTRTVEYTLVPQQTGTFTLPAMRVPYFDPEARRYEEMAVDPVTITVRPGVNGAQTVTVPGAPDAENAPKNQLVAGGLKSLRHTAHFTEPRQTISRQRWFLPVTLAPLLLSLLAGGALFVRNSLGPETDASKKKKEAQAARKRLAAAQKLLAAGSTENFYSEVERALMSFMAARLGVPVIGLTRDQLSAKLVEANVHDAERTRILAVLETCDLGRYAPGMGDASARQRALDDAAHAMEGWS